MIETYIIPEDRLPELNGKVDKLNKRARKIGVAQIEINQVGHEDKEIRDKDNRGTGRYRRWFTVEVSGQTPKYNGWSFISSIDHTTEGNILRKVSGHDGDLPEEFRDSDSHRCDHCHVNRFRRQTFVVRHDDGQWKQVGRTCIQDFLGGVDPHSVARACEILASIHSFCEMLEDEDADRPRGYGQDHRICLDTFLYNVAALTQRFAFITRKAAQENGGFSTSMLALENMFPPPKKPKSEIVEVTDKAKETATNARQWALDTFGDREDLNDFEHNLVTVAKADLIEERLTGIAAYLIEAYRKHLGQKNEPKVKSQHFGVKKERLRGLKLVLQNQFSFDTDFGTKYIHILVTEEGNIAKWGTTNNLGGAEIGDEITLDGTVKDHEVYKGRNQTVLTRCSVI